MIADALFHSNNVETLRSQRTSCLPPCTPKGDYSPTDWPSDDGLRSPILHLHSVTNIRAFILAVVAFLAVAFVQPTYAQDSGRAASTKIVDALNQLPAQNAELFNRLMEDIVSTGQEGIGMLIAALEKKDASMIQVEYALDGLSAYASAESFDPQKRKLIINAFEGAVLRLKSSDTEKLDEDLLQFYARQLKRLGVIVSEETLEPEMTLKEAEKALAAATKIAKKDPSQLNIARRCLALRRLLGITGIVEGEKQILKAIADPCREYRFAALYSMNGKNPSLLYDYINAKLPKLNDEAKADVIWWLGEQKDSYNGAAVLPFLASSDFEVVEASAWALTKMKSPDAVKQIATFLTREDSSFVVLAEQCLKSSSGDVASVVAAMMPEAGVMGQKAILSILSQRKSDEHQDIVFKAIKSQNMDLTFAAYDALKDVVRIKDLNRLYNLLETEDLAFAEPIRKAILSATSDLSRQKRFEMFTARKDKVSKSLQGRYWPLIISTADIDELYRLCVFFKENPIPATPSTGGTIYSDMALKTYLNTIVGSNAPGAQRLLLLRKAMEIAETDNRRKEILDAVGRTDTFLGILFAGDFLETPALQQDAAQAIMRIALAHPEFHGSQVTTLLNRVCEVLSGPDAGYEITAVKKHLGELPSDEGFVSMFNGKDLIGWKGLVENPFVRAKMKPAALAKAQKEADARMAENWKVEDGCIVYEGTGYDNLCTAKQYGDFEMYIDWKLFPGPEADAGIYLRGTPQVQIWDTARVNVGAEVGSGGLYNNVKNPSKPPCVADNAVGEWNSFYIKMIGERVTVYLNGVLVVDNVILENYWDRSYSIFLKEQIELQAHGSKVAYRNLYIRELEQVQPYTLSEQERKEGFKLLFDGTSLHNWQGNTVDYYTSNGTIEVSPTGQGFGNLYTNEEYSDFIFRFEFKLTPGANNGVGIRTPTEGDAAYVGMEIQILDHFDPIYQPWLRDYQYHGSIYGIIPAKVTDALNPVGEWNTEEIYAKGNHIRVTVNGIVITEGDIAEATKNGTYDGNEHPGLFNKSGHIAFLGHGSQIWLRNIRVKDLR